uniref:glycosyltransferase family 1 protein n=1 Tax=Agathobacter sp. TaxID=2021311 RepID=UPI0040577249
MKKILVFGMTENPGGMESVIVNYYRAINKEEYQFDFLCNSYEKIAYEDELIALGGKAFHFPARSRDLRGYRKALVDFFEKHANEYHAIWVNVCSLANIDYLKFAKKYGIKKRIIHSHNSQNMDSRLRGLLHKWNKRSIDKYATDFWSCSEEAGDWFYKADLKENVVLIHNAIDVKKMCFDLKKREDYRKKLGWSNAYVIGNIGRLHFQKNQQFLLDVFYEIVKLLPKARLVLIGQGEDEAMLREKVNRLELQDKVHFAGIQYDIKGWLSAFDCFLFPSVFEGLPLAALEAQANGVPMLASESAVPEAGRINPNFLAMDLQESPKDWAKKVIGMKESCFRMEGKEIESNFTNAGYNIETEVKKIEKLFQEANA